jgi:tetratricopeptide (TPR) repeat protein
MPNALQQCVFEVAEETETPMIDAAERLARESVDGIVGFDWYVDQVHPTIRGHQLIAQAVAARLRDAKIPELASPSWSPAERRVAYRDHMTALGDYYLAAGRRRVEWLESWARRDRLREDTAPIDARGIRDLGNCYVEFAEYAQARVAYELALSEDPDGIVDLLRRCFELFQSGRNSAARRIADIVLRASQVEAHSDLARVALAICALEDGRLEDATLYADEARSGSFDLSDDVSAWLVEAPDARALFAAGR